MGIRSMGIQIRGENVLVRVDDWEKLNARSSTHLSIWFVCAIL